MREKHRFAIAALALWAVPAVYSVVLSRRPMRPDTAGSLARPIDRAPSRPAPRPMAPRAAEDRSRPPRRSAPAPTDGARWEADKEQPLPFPARLEEKYLEKELLANVQRAFAELGLKSYESAADCSEYPCIVCTSFNEKEFSVDDLAKLNRAKALDAYEDSDSAACVRVATHEANGTPIRSPAACLSFRPKGEDETDPRTQKRMVELCGGI